MREPAESVASEMINEVVRYVRCGEKIVAAARAFAPLLQAVNDLKELDGELTPELAVVAQHLAEAQEALQRAFVFQDARYDAAIDRLGKELLP